MAEQQIDISIIIVNYKVKEFLANLISSLRKAGRDLNIEIFVVDNASDDGSVEYLRSKFPDVEYIENDTNIGFGRANNQAIERVNGKYTLLINPDAIVREDTLEVMHEHMERHPDCGAAGCKILNPDGSYAPESQRSIPTIWSALCKLLGLSSLFPNSRYFNQYYVNDKEENETGEVPVLSGSFMFFRSSVLKQLDGFDDRFFMYGEDIDLCYRLQHQTDYKIHYVADTSIIHYKGESTKKDDLHYIKNFNKALYLFFDKHYTYRYSLLFRLIIYVGILLRAVISFLKNKAYTYRGILLDLVIINFTLLVAFPWRFGIGLPDLLEPTYLRFFWINVLTSLLYVFFSSSFGVVKRDPYSIIGSLKSVLASYTGVVIITFFIRSLAFSRVVIVASGIVSFLVIGFIRLMRKNAHKNPSHTRGRIKPTRVLIVGVGEKTEELIEKLRSRVDWDYEIVGIVSQLENSGSSDTVNRVEVVGTVEQIPELIRSYNVDQLLFLLNAVSYKQVLHILTEISDLSVVSKLVPDSMDFMLGKSNVEYLADIPVIDLEISYKNLWSRIVKRSLEWSIVIPALIMGAPLFGILTLFGKSSPETISVKDDDSRVNISLYKPLVEHRWRNLYIMFWHVLKGNIRLVGAPMWPPVRLDYYGYEYGITGLAQVNAKRIFSQEDREQFDIYYLQNYSIWQDLDILARTIFNGPSPCAYLQKQFERYGDADTDTREL